MRLEGMVAWGHVVRLATQYSNGWQLETLPDPKDWTSEANGLLFCPGGFIQALFGEFLLGNCDDLGGHFVGFLENKNMKNGFAK